MRRFVVTGTLICLLGWMAVPAQAQDKSARGSVTAVAGDVVTVKAGTQELKLTVDAKTEIIAEGAGTANRAAVAKGAAGAKLADLVKVGENVEVSYREAGGMMHATTIRKVRSAGAGGVSEPKPAAMSSNGTVTAVTGTSLTITGSSGGGGTFTQTFTVDNMTKVVAEGAGTASAKGKVTVTDLVSKGSRVTVTYKEAANNTLLATEVRVHGSKP
jgi:uncharacterized protein DUF5666